MSRKTRKRGAGRKRRDRRGQSTPYRKHEQGVDGSTAAPLESGLPNETMTETDTNFRQGFEILKADAALGVVFGWAIVSKVDGEDYYDLQGDHITEAAALDAAVDFMVGDLEQKDMHVGKRRGTAVLFPMTEDVAKAFGFDTGGKFGVLAMAKPDPELFKLHQSGERTGFSIGGYAPREFMEEID